MFLHKAFRDFLFKMLFVVPWFIAFQLALIHARQIGCKGSLYDWAGITLIYYGCCILFALMQLPCRVEILQERFYGRLSALMILNAGSYCIKFISGIVIFVGLWLTWFIEDAACSELYSTVFVHFIVQIVILALIICTYEFIAFFYQRMLISMIFF